MSRAWTAGRRLDRAIDRGLFGDTDEDGEAPGGFPPHYSTDPGDAMRLLERMKAEGQRVLLGWDADENLWECLWTTGGDCFTGLASSAPLAICRAAIRGIERRAPTASA